MTAIFLIEEQWINNSLLVLQHRLTTRIDNQPQSFNMWHEIYYKGDTCKRLHLHYQSIHHEQSWTLNAVALILFKDKSLPHSHLQCLCLTARSHHNNGNFYIYFTPRQIIQPVE